MGPVEARLRKVKRLKGETLVKVYSNAECGRVLIGARISLSLTLDELEGSMAEVFSEAIEAASALRL